MLVRKLLVLLWSCGLLWISHGNAQIAGETEDDVIDMDALVEDEEDAKKNENTSSIHQHPHDDVQANEKADTLKQQSEEATGELAKEKSSDVYTPEETSDGEAFPSSKDADEDTTSTTASSTQSNAAATGESAADQALLEDLARLTNDELEAVCLERGFEIRKADGTGLTRDDLLGAAVRCLKLEEEMNSVLEDNPELALELEAEIERMKEEKDRLEAEQAAMMEEKSTLEEQLREAGIDPGSVESQTSKGGTSLSARTPTDTPETLEEVLRTSFTMLYQRIGADIILIGKLLGYVARPTGSALALVWRYTGPTVEGFIQRSLIIADTIRLMEPCKTICTIVSLQAGFLKSTAWPLLQIVSTRALAVLSMGLAKLDAVETGHKAIVLVGAVLGPLKDSLLIGWRNTLRPNLSLLRRKTGAWIRRLREEASIDQQNA